MLRKFNFVFWVAAGWVNLRIWFAFWETMAVAVICGPAVQALLSLVFVPTVYSIVDDMKNFLAKRLSKLTSVTQEDKINAMK